METHRQSNRPLAPLAMGLIVALLLAGCAAAPTAAPALALAPTVEAQRPAPAAIPPTPVAPTAAAQPTEVPVAQSAAGPSPTEAPEKQAFVWEPDGIVSADEYSGSVATAGVTFHWRTDGEFLYGALAADTTGWVAVGFDPAQRMQGANYVYGWVKDGQAEVMDMFGTRPTGPGSHPLDTELGGQSHIVAFGGAEADGATIIEFQIPLDSTDPNDKPLAVGKTHTILLAFGAGDDLNYHTQRGATTFTLSAE